MRQLMFEPEGANPWIETRDGDDTVRAIFDEHYSRRNDARKFVGPGQHIVLRTAAADAIFVWRKEKYRRDGRKGVNCAVFRNEGALLSSGLILWAEEFSSRDWPGERLFTFVDPGAVRSSNPGYCFLMAGWTRTGVTSRGYIVLEKWK